MAPGGLTITFAVAPGFATLAAGEYIPIALSENGTREVVHLTAYTAGALTGTIERAQEGSAAGTFTTAGKWHHGPTAQDLDRLLVQDELDAPWMITAKSSGAIALRDPGDIITGQAHTLTPTLTTTSGQQRIRGFSFTPDADITIQSLRAYYPHAGVAVHLSIWRVSDESELVGMDVTIATAGTWESFDVTGGLNLIGGEKYIVSIHHVGNYTNYYSSLTDLQAATSARITVHEGRLADGLVFPATTDPNYAIGYVDFGFELTPRTVVAATSDHVHSTTGLALEGHTHEGGDTSDANLIVGSGAPSVTRGLLGDYWLDQATRKVYGPKAAAYAEVGGSATGPSGTSANSSDPSLAIRYTATADITVDAIANIFDPADKGLNREIRYLITDESFNTLAETAWTSVDGIPDSVDFFWIPLQAAYTIANGTSFWVAYQTRDATTLAPAIDVTSIVGLSAATAIGTVSQPAGDVRKHWDGHDLTATPKYSFTSWGGAWRLGSGDAEWPATENYALATVQPADHPFFVAGTIGAGESLVSGWQIHDALTQTLVRVIAYLRDTPTGANATNHAKLVVSDGTTSVDVPLSSDVVKHTADIALARVTEITQAGAVATTSLMEGRATPFVPDANESIDIIGIRLSNPSAAAANVELAILSSTRTILGSVTVSVPANSAMSEVIGTLATPVALTAGTTYHLAYRADIDISHDVSSAAAWTGAAGGGASHYYTIAPVDFATSQGTETYYLIGALYSRDATPTFGPELSVRVVAVGNPPPDAGGDLNLIVTTEAVQ